MTLADAIEEVKPKGATCEVNCDRCKKGFTARVADRKRGWARFCSKSCKAIKQTQVTGISGPNYRAEGMKVKQMKKGKFAPSKLSRGDSLYEEDDRSWDAHKSWL